MSTSNIRDEAEPQPCIAGVPNSNASVVNSSLTCEIALAATADNARDEEEEDSTDDDEGQDERECEDCGNWIDAEESMDNDGLCYSCVENIRVNRVRQRLPGNFTIREVAGNHRKPCSECGKNDWCDGDWYIHDASHPWDTEKFCFDCAEGKNWGDDSSLDDDNDDECDDNDDDDNDNDDDDDDGEEEEVKERGGEIGGEVQQHQVDHSTKGPKLPACGSFANLSENETPPCKKRA
ncbi:hypothetical protein ACA910_003037 [Epithemia clementina (nom. ined.)]